MATPRRDVVGREAFSRDGSRIGKVKQVLGEGDARYLVIGRFLGREVVVPESVTEQQDDELRLPFATSFLGSSPRVKVKAGLSEADRRRLDEFYRGGRAA